ncbi:MAG TPA: S24 family peptidase [Candidatus Limiplasma sp.]|nr:S24 family peptidase [Candidatus Limiplasma sp.]HPS81266.1 S24 family peptidase [Candidatus Limiplasma sp.]
MSRLGDLLKTERMRRKLTLKQVAKVSGVSESFLKDVEEGKRIIADEQARRILKKIGLNEQTEQGFTLDDIAATVDLETVKPTASKPAVTKPPQRSETETVYRDSDGDKDQVQGSVWLDALTSVLKRVPVYNAVMKETDHRLLPILDGRIEGAAPDKVFYYSVPDDSMRGFRILKEDLCLMVPAGSPIDGAVMLVEHNEHRYLRKIKKLDALNVLLQSYDREYAAEPCAIPDAAFLGRVVKVEFTL